MGYERNQHSTDTRRTVDPDRATHLVNVHLSNDIRHHTAWTQSAQEIWERVPDSLSAAQTELLEDGVISETEAVRLQLATRIRENVEETFRAVHRIGTEDILGDAAVPGLMSAVLERFMEAVRWQAVARGFMPDEE
jgi:hypothetical protein